MKTEVMTITPAMAEKWLAGTTFKNRNVSITAVNRYANDIQNGQWMLNGESIIIDDNGNVIDGQHRLRAILKSGASIQSVVVRGIDAATFQTLDCGKKRNHGDVLSISGYANANLLAAGLRLIHCYRSDRSLNFDRGSGSLSKYRISVLDLVQKYPEAVESAAYIKSVSKYSGLARPGSFAVFVHYEFTQANKDAANEFFHAVFEGIPRFGDKCPSLELRKKYGSLEHERLMRLSNEVRLNNWKSCWVKFLRLLEKERCQPRFKMSLR